MNRTFILKKMHFSYCLVYLFLFYQLTTNYFKASHRIVITEMQFCSNFQYAYEYIYAILKCPFSNFFRLIPCFSSVYKKNPRIKFFKLSE